MFKPCRTKYVIYLNTLSTINFFNALLQCFSIASCIKLKNSEIKGKFGTKFSGEKISVFMVNSNITKKIRSKIIRGHFSVPGEICKRLFKSFITFLKRCQIISKEIEPSFFSGEILF